MGAKPADSAANMETLKEKSELQHAIASAEKLYKGAMPDKEKNTALGVKAQPAYQFAFVETDEAEDVDEPEKASSGPAAAKKAPKKKKKKATGATTGAATGPVNDTVVPFAEPEDPELAGAKAKVEITKVACDHANEFLQNATEAWDDERQDLLAKLKTAHMSISDAHTDQKEAAGDMVLGNLETALEDTKKTLSMRPKVKALRKVKDKATVTQKKACLVYQAAVDELQGIRDERIKV